MRLMGPKLSVPALQSGSPCTVMQWPFASISGWSGPYRPVSSAAAAVTVLKVDPGA